MSDIRRRTLSLIGWILYPIAGGLLFVVWMFASPDTFFPVFGGPMIEVYTHIGFPVGNFEVWFLLFGPYVIPVIAFLFGLVFGLLVKVVLEVVRGLRARHPRVELA